LHFGFICQFLDILSDLKGENPALFKNFTPSDYRENARIGSYDLKAVNDLVNDIEYCIEIISGFKDIKDSKVDITKQGIFFAGKTFDALLNISSLIIEANEEIILIDGYLNEDILQVLTSKKENLQVKVLTKKLSLVKMKSFIDAFNKQYNNLEVRTSENYHFSRWKIVLSHICFNVS